MVDTQAIKWPISLTGAAPIMQCECVYSNGEHFTQKYICLYVRLQEKYTHELFFLSQKVQWTWPGLHKTNKK